MWHGLLAPLRKSPVWAAVALLYVVATIVTPAMLKPGQNPQHAAGVLIPRRVAAGQTLALLAGGIDLSQAGVVTLVNIVAADVMAGSDSNIAVAVLVCAGLSLVSGC